MKFQSCDSADTHVIAAVTPVTLHYVWGGCQSMDMIADLTVKELEEKLTCARDLLKNAKDSGEREQYSLVVRGYEWLLKQKALR